MKNLITAAALAAFTERGRRERLAYLEIFRRRRALMADALERVPHVTFAPPDGAFYFWVDVSHHGPGIDVARRILERCNVLVIPGPAFGGGAEGFIRVSFAAAEDAIERGVQAIAGELG